MASLCRAWLIPFGSVNSGSHIHTFITALHTLAEHCNFGTLTDEMIKDRIVVGLVDEQLSEKLKHLFGSID